MPTYEYECAQCKVTYELRQGFDAEITHTCEECGKGVARRILHAPRVVFKGSGWYATDSRKSQSAMSDSPDTGASEPAAATATPAAKESAPKGAKDSGSGPQAAAAG